MNTAKFLLILMASMISYSAAGQSKIDIWIPMDQSKNVSIASKTLFDIPFPNAKVDGKIKFIRSVDPDSYLARKYKVGYIVNVEVDSIDREKLPKDYEKPKKVLLNGKVILFTPVPNMFYDAELEFSFLDKDGFTLSNVITRTHSIQSGIDGKKSDNFIQDQAGDFHLDLINRIASVKLTLNVLKCTTCK